MTDKPSVLFISSCDVPSDEIVKLIVKETEPITINDDIDAYPYHIDNKYYTTDINLCSLKRKVLAGESFATTVQGTVIYFDSSDKDCLKIIESWLPFLKEYQAEIKILVCKNCPEEGNEGCRKRTVQEWCIGNGFELVELEPDVDEDEDDDFPETTGVSRIIQALNAHVWPNLVMKNSKNRNESTERNVQMELSDLARRLSLEESIDEILEHDDDFMYLYSKLPELRARVSTLEGSERVSAVYDIVAAFFAALDNNPEVDDILDL